MYKRCQYYMCLDKEPSPSGRILIYVVQQLACCLGQKRLHKTSTTLLSSTSAAGSILSFLGVRWLPLDEGASMATTLMSPLDGDDSVSPASPSPAAEEASTGVKDGTGKAHKYLFKGKPPGWGVLSREHGTSSHIS